MPYGIRTRRLILNPNYPPNRGRVGWWLVTSRNFGATSWYDIVAGLPATLTGFGTNTGWNDLPQQGGVGSIYLPGDAVANAYLSATNNRAFASYPFTAAFWGNWSLQSPFAQRPAWAFGYDGNNLTAGWGFEIDSGSPGKLFFSYFVNNGANFPAFQTTFNTPTAGAWTHYLVTIDSAGSRFYQNGQKVNSQAWNGTPGAPTVSTPLFFGTDHLQTHYRQGYFNDFGLWKRAFSDSEVLDLYTQSRLGYPGAFLTRKKLFAASSGSALEGLANLQVTTAETASGRLAAEGKKNLVLSLSATTQGRLLADGRSSTTANTSLGAAGRLLADGKSPNAVSTSLGVLGRGVYQGALSGGIVFSSFDVGHLAADGHASLTAQFLDNASGRLSADGRASPVLSTVLFPSGKGTFRSFSSTTLTTTLVSLGRLFAAAKSDESVLFTLLDEGRAVLGGKSSDAVTFTFTPFNSMQGLKQGQASLLVTLSLLASGRLLAGGKSDEVLQTSLASFGHLAAEGKAPLPETVTLTALPEVTRFGKANWLLSTLLGGRDEALLRGILSGEVDFSLLASGGLAPKGSGLLAQLSTSLMAVGHLEAGGQASLADALTVLTSPHVGWDGRLSSEVVFALLAQAEIFNLNTKDVLYFTRVLCDYVKSTRTMASSVLSTKAMS